MMITDHFIDQAYAERNTEGLEERTWEQALAPRFLMIKIMMMMLIMMLMMLVMILDDDDDNDNDINNYNDDDNEKTNLKTRIVLMSMILCKER